MESRTVLWSTVAAAVVAVLAAVLPFFVRLPAAPAPLPDRESAAAVTALAALGAQHQSLRGELAALQQRVTACEAVRAPAPVAPAVGQSAAPGPIASSPPVTDATADRRGFRERMPAMLRQGSGSPVIDEAEQERFWRLARTTDVVDSLIAELEASVAASPRDVAARMELADAYTARLVTIPGGPEQGVWGGKAEREWQAVIGQQPDHWDARFQLGFNYSMYPDFVDRSKEAIEHLEHARTLLPGRAPEPRQVDVYLGLARMYRRQQRDDRAAAVLDEGLLRFPGHEGLQRARHQGGGSSPR
ncbi:MAG: hypothetical protein IPK26_11260 [Planctomycetes bacterium]|nr:hypothetical protein [Planctomycetota bacterium]